MVYTKEHIIHLLIEQGLLSPQDSRSLLEPVSQGEQRLSIALLEKKSVSKETLSAFVKANFNIPQIDIGQLKITPGAIKSITSSAARAYNVFPLLKTSLGLTLGLSDPLTIFDLHEIASLKSMKINPVLVPYAELMKLIDAHYPQAPEEGDFKSVAMEDVFGHDFAAITEKAHAQEGAIEDAELAHITQEMPIVKATNFVLFKAIEYKASDILIEPLEDSSRIRFRIDGVYHLIENLPRSFHPFIICRVKVMSEMDIAEHRFPQDGQFKLKLNGRNIDFRVSVFPTINGEKAALRILDTQTVVHDVDQLGLRKVEVEKLKRVALLPYGMMLVCGPTGSGKTSTLYSLLNYVHTPEKNIITVEDPVECHMRGINQVSVNLKTGLNFSRCLRSILRQDPDIIMIGEIRDLETVDIAIKAALTGHLVLSTLHTTTAAGSIVRLKDMGVEPFLINASLMCIIAQRLARRICTHCKEPVATLPYFRGKGCKECMQTGYKGRVLIPEILHMSGRIQAAVVAEKVDERLIKEIAVSEGMKTMREEGEELCRQGITTIDEVIRVTPAD